MTAGRCVPIGPDARARVSPDAPPELLDALAALAEAARRDFGAPADTPPTSDVTR